MYMATRGLSEEALTSAATDLCAQATRARARGEAWRSEVLIEAAASLLVRRKYRRASVEDHPQPIIVVDDDPGIRESISELLIDSGYQVRCFPNGAEALDYLRRRPGAALVLLDLMMPVMSGWTFHEHLRRDRRLAEIPVIAISAGCERPPPSIRLLPKPVSVDDLLEAVSDSMAVANGEQGRSDAD
jgi:CheY-like chemotaxis protein